MSDKRAEAVVGSSAPIFAALGDETRLRVVARLCTGGPASIAGLTEAVDVTRQAVAKHLRVLEQAGLVRGTRRGREQVYQIEQARLLAAQRSLELISAQWDRALERLRAHVEES